MSGESVDQMCERLVQESSQGLTGLPLQLQELHGSGISEFAAAIADECARICEAYVWFEDGNRSPDESNIGCAEAIRHRFQINTDAER